jgi:hypothetical protein
MIDPSSTKKCRQAKVAGSIPMEGYRSGENALPLVYHIGLAIPKYQRKSPTPHPGHPTAARLLLNAAQTITMQSP